MPLWAPEAMASAVNAQANESDVVHPPCAARKVASHARSVAWPTLWREEEETDAGTSASEAETACSSAGISDKCEVKKQQADAARGLNMGQSLPSQRRVFLPHGFKLGQSGPFYSTPLSPIPGTPVASHQNGSRCGPEAPLQKPFEIRRASAANSRPATAAKQLALSPHALVAAQASPSKHMARSLRRGAGSMVPSAVLARDSHGSPLAPAPALQMHPQDVMFLHGQQNALPVKVWLPEHLVKPVRAYDPMLPVKKLPVYLEFAASASDSLRKLDRDLPVKMRVPSFLLQDPPSLQPCILAR